MFDVLLPLSHLLEAHPNARVCYPLQDLSSPFAAILTMLYHERVRIAEDVPRRAFPIAGWNPLFYPRSAADWAAFRKHVFERTSVQRPERVEDVVLINRLNPGMGAEITKAGAARRSIRNQAELSRVLGEAIRSPYRLVDAHPERLSFRDQVRLFAGAAAVIGQHGAGLGHVVWMPSTSLVAEIGYGNRNHFVSISRQVGIEHFLYGPTSERHIDLDVAAFCNWLECETPFHRFFQFDTRRTQGARSQSPA
ncbi:MAG: glycosyltransferase family 61 protein [Arenicellales bacterium]